MKITNDIVDFESSIGPWLGKTVKIVDYCINELFNQHAFDLTKEQFIVLKKLYDKDGVNQNELAFLTLRNKSSLTRLLAKMEKKSYLKRKQNETDKRVNHVFLTDLGKETFTRVQPILKVLIQTIEQNISTEEKNMFIETLKKIQFNLTSKIESL